LKEFDFQFSNKMAED